MIRRWRMASGLVLFAYVATHLVNHSLGIVSVAAMEAMLGWVHPVWTSVPGTLAIYGAFLVHVALAFFALWERRLFHLRPLEALQYALGFSIPVLAATHLAGTRINDSFLGMSWTRACRWSLRTRRPRRPAGRIFCSPGRRHEGRSARTRSTTTSAIGLPRLRNVTQAESQSTASAIPSIKPHASAATRTKPARVSDLMVETPAKAAATTRTCSTVPS